MAMNRYGFYGCNGFFYGKNRRWGERDKRMNLYQYDITG